MNESQKDIDKAHEATASLQGIAAAIEREREVLGRADSDPRGEERSASATSGAAHDKDAPDAPTGTAMDGHGVQEALRLFPVQAQNPR